MTTNNSLLSHVCKTIPKEKLHLPGPDWIDRVFLSSNRSTPVLNNLQRLFNHGRLGRTGYLNILPVDQGVEHSAGTSFAVNPDYFDPENLFKLALEGGASAIASTLGVLGSLSRKYAHHIPLILKLNHNESLTYPSKYDQVMFASVREAWEMGCVAVGATIYFGAPESDRQLEEVRRVFETAHEMGMATLLWCYLRNSAFKEYQEAADLTGQANHLGASLGADIVKQKLPTCNGGFKALQFGKQTEAMYTKLCTDNPIDRVRYQVANNYMGRVGLINSGGPSGENDLDAAVETAIINKRGGGVGLIVGRKAFQKPLKEGIKLLHAVQDVYLSKEITIA